MEIAEEYKYLFDIRTRKRGELYFLKGSVEKPAVKRNVVKGGVKGRRVYPVEIRFYKDHTPELYCACPFFNEWGKNCKHLWALFLFIDSMVAEGEIRYASLFPDEKEGDPRAWKGFQKLLEAGKKGRGERIVEDKAGFYPFYYLDAGVSSRRSRLTFIVKEVYRKLNGKWGRERDFSEEIDNDVIVNSDDRRILAVLAGYKKVFPSRFYTEGYSLMGDISEYVIPDMMRTGRLRLTREDGTIDNLTVDTTGNWKYEITMKSNGKGYALHGLWKKGRKKLFPKDLDLFIIDESIWFLHGNVLYKKEKGVGSEWENYLYTNGSITIRNSDCDDFIAYFNSHQDQMPAVRFPKELLYDIEKLCGIKPFIYLSFSHNKFWGEVAFLYNDKHEFSLLNDSIWFFDMRNKKRIKRDKSRENKWLQQLEKTGFTKTGDWYYCDSGRIFNTIKDLSEKGWAVFGEDKKTSIKFPSRLSLQVKTGIDWFEIKGNVSFDGAALSITNAVEALKRGSRFVELGAGELGVLPKEWIDKYSNVFELAQKDKDGYRISKTKIGLFDAWSEDKHVTFDRTSSRMRNKIKHFQGIHISQPSKKFKGVLREYQKFGLGWLEFLDEYNFGGCLGDDMGLGKTIQVLSFLQKAKEKNVSYSLIVVPASIIFNWLSEGDKFTPDLKILPFWGVDRKRYWKKRKKHDIILTSYSTMVRDIDLLADESFSYVIFDESQNLKNPWAKRTRVARRLNARIKLSLTGTPLENHLGDLWSQFSVVSPGLLGSLKQFKEKYIAGKDTKTLQNLISPFILRRKKEEVLQDLPEKVEEILYCEMDQSQREFYNEVRDILKSQLLRMIDERGINKSRMNILEGLLRLRQICCYPGLVDKRRKSYSGKFELLKTMVKEVVEENHKALIFSQFTQMLSVVRQWVEKTGICYEYLDGSTRNKKEPVTAFQNNDECRLFLISLKAGGVGLNLTAADYVFLYDPWWNPAVETQAVDRAYRMGQKNTVFTYRFITRESIEEKILVLQKEKKKLIDDIIIASENPVAQFAKKDIAFLFS